MPAMIHNADEASTPRLERLPPLIRALIPEADLADLTDAEFEELSKLDPTPATLCGPNLLWFHNLMREHARLV